MDEQTKRLMIFMLLAMPLIMFHIAGQTAKKKQMVEQQQLIEQQQASETPLGQTTAQPTGAAPYSGPNAVDTPSSFSAPAPEPVYAAQGEDIILETDAYRIVFTTAGAYPTSWRIIDPTFAKIIQLDVDKAIEDFPNIEPPRIGDFKPIELIPDYEGIAPDREYPLMVVLKESGGKYHQILNRMVYEVEGPTVGFSPDGVEETVLRFTSPVTPSGLRMVKTFHFPVDGFLSRLEIEVENIADVSQNQVLAFDETGLPGLGLLWGPGIGPARYHDRWDASQYKVASSTGEEVLSKHFGDWEKAREKTVEEVWGERNESAWTWGMLDSRFYTAAIIPDVDSPLVRGVVRSQHVPALKDARDKMACPAIVEVFSGGFRLQPNGSQTFSYDLFAGPKQRSLLVEVDKTLGTNLRRIMFQSDWWLSDNLIRPLALFMLGLLGTFYEWTGSYGLAIILVVLVMRLLTQPFTHMGMKSQARVMAEQQRIKPLIDAINEKYKDDPQKKSAETWKTYREHGVNPLGMLKGCGWMLIQMPIFFALYRLLLGAIDLRGEGFLWIADLTAPDALFMLPFHLPFLGNKFNLLPILMGLSQLVAQRLQSTNIQDPTQKQMATIMPIMFIFILYNFAAGLSLYWFVSNLWQIVFQIFVNRKVKEEAEQKAVKAFEARQEAIASGTFKKKKENEKPTWRQRLMQGLEAKAKEAEAQRKRRGK